MTKLQRTGVVLQFVAERRSHGSGLGDLDRSNSRAQLCNRADARVLPLPAGNPGNGVVVNASVPCDVAPGAGSLARLECGDNLIEAHKAMLGIRALSVKALTPKASRHHSEVTEQDSQASVFRENIKVLIGDGSVNAWAKAHGLEQTTVNRIVNGETDPKLSMIERVAKALRVEVWQLLVPGFKLDDRPELRSSARSTAEDLADRMDRVLSELKEIKRAPAPPSVEDAPKRRMRR